MKHKTKRQHGGAMLELALFAPWFFFLFRALTGFAFSFAVILAAMAK